MIAKQVNRVDLLGYEFLLIFKLNKENSTIEPFLISNQNNILKLV
jgi:hypothetical protein